MWSTMGEAQGQQVDSLIATTGAPADAVGRVLVVEDDAGIAALERRRLERAGYVVAVAASAEAALALVREGGIALIVLDEGLPGGLTGLAFYHQLTAAGYHIPVIMVTGRGDEAMILAALRAGVADFVTKSSAFLDYLPEAVGRALVRAATARRLVESERRFRATVEQAAVGLAHLGLDGRWLLANQRLCDIVGRSRAALLAIPYQALLHPEDRAAQARAVRQLLAGEVSTSALEVRYVRGDGAAVWAALTLSLLQAEDGAPLYFIAVIEDIGARKAAEAERDALLRRERAAREQAQATARAQEQYLIAASHELKTPLATIKGYAELLGRRIRELIPAPAGAERALAHLQGQIRRMEALVADLLELSRLRHGHPAPSPTPVELGVLARRVLDHLAPSDDSPRHTLVLDAPTPVSGWWEAAQIERALANLVGNALKYSPAGGEVRVRIGLDTDRAEVAVSDQGVGIPRSEHAAIFAPFIRGSTAPNLAEGTGLGLHLAATIVARHGGTIDVVSTPGRGSTFTIWLPLRPTADAQVIQPGVPGDGARR